MKKKENRVIPWQIEVFAISNITSYSSNHSSDEACSSYIRRERKKFAYKIMDLFEQMKSPNDAKPVLSDADVRWLPRYSSTIEDDDMGRWARVAYAGKFDNMGFWRGKVCRWEIAWVKKMDIKGELKFTISYLYPSNGKHLFNDLEAAQKEVEQTFRWFMKMCGGKISCR